MISKLGHGGAYLTRIRDHGGGRVEIDENGEAQVYYTMNHEQDVETMRLAIDSLIKLFVEAGAQEFHLMGDAPSWRVGDDLDEYMEKVRRVPLGFGGIAIFSAHQMGTCRMGSDPSTSVANPKGELHDTPGVWIGDTSAFPTASGTNPMWSVLALSHRTAEFIATDAHGA